MRKIRFGVLGAAKIARTKVIPGMQAGDLTEVTAISSRTKDSARAVADELGIPKAYGGYETLLADPDVDAVYIPLPNHLHVDWSIRALEAGKHVLCEKPLGLDSKDIARLMEAAAQHPELQVMEAFMYRFHPQWEEAKRLVDAGEIGPVASIQSYFSYFNADPGNIRNRAEMGGGGMMDIGCYNISLSRFLFGGEPDRVCGFMDRDPDFGTDRLFSGMMDFSGRVSTFTCSTQLAGHQRVDILGAKGRIELPIPFNAPPDEPTRLILQREEHKGTDRHLTTIEFPACDQYTVQGDRFAKAILAGGPTPTPLDDALANMRVLEVLLESADAARWITCRS